MVHGRTGLDLWNTATLIVCAVLLGFVIWRIDMLESNLTERPALSGQWVEIGGVRTERYVDEPIERWRARQFEAMRAFQEGD